MTAVVTVVVLLVAAMLSLRWIARRGMDDDDE